MDQERVDAFESPVEVVVEEPQCVSGLAFLALFLGATGIGFAPIFVRLSEVGPVSTAFWRVFLAQPILWSIFWFQDKTHPKAAKPEVGKQMGWLLLAGSIFCFNMSIWHWSIHFTSVANATIFSNMAPIFVTLVGYFLLKERVTLLFIVGLGLTLTGAFLIGGNSFSLGWDNLFGDLLGVLTAFFYGSYLMTVNHVRGRFSAPTVMAFAGVASVFWLSMLAPLTESNVIPQSTEGWLSVLGLAMVSHVMGQGMIAYGLGHLPTSLSSVILLFQPVVAAVAAWILLNEPMQTLQMFGGLVVLLGIYTAKRGAI
ncbi:MAG: DMT family transporter [Candidatus Omnitrophica bacterium]|nr:DMT family transporter [Candidatus Omnitrophota bacterium]